MKKGNLSLYTATNVELGILFPLTQKVKKEKKNNRRLKE